MRIIYPITNALMGQAPSRGAIPTLLAAASKEARPGGFYGPQSMGETRGKVSDAIISDAALHQETAQWLWQESEKLTNFKWPDFSNN